MLTRGDILDWWTTLVWSPCSGKIWQFEVKWWLLNIWRRVIEFFNMGVCYSDINHGLPISFVGRLHKIQAVRDEIWLGVVLRDEDMVRNCFAQSSRLDYGALALVNQRLNLPVRSRDPYILRRQLGIVEHWFTWPAIWIDGKRLIPHGNIGCACPGCLLDEDPHQYVKRV